MTIGVVIFLVVGPLCPTGDGDAISDWRCYANSRFGVYKYDTATLRRLNANIVQVG